jgi:hypothetical protein
MQIANLISAGSVAALTALAAPALAKHSEAQKPTESATSSSPCHAYQMAPDGSWTQLACQEAGAAGQPARKSATRSGVVDNATR